MAQVLNQAFAQDLGNDLRLRIAEGLWPHGLPDLQTRLPSLNPYFQYYSDRTLAATSARCNTHSSLLALISQAKVDPNRTRAQILNQWQINTAQAQTRGEESPDLAIAIWWMFYCKAPSSSVVTTGATLEHTWREDVSLAAFADEVFPRYTLANYSPSVSSISLNSFKATSLTRYFRILPTANIAEHFNIRDVTKGKPGLTIFHHVTFLQESLRLTDGMALSSPTVDYLRRGSLPRPLLLETLQTIRLIFPADDSACSRLLKNFVETSEADPQMCALASPDVSSVNVRTSQSLLRQYPFWGPRMLDLVQEMETPSPTNWIERWADRRKSPRFTYWLGVVTLVFALMFGIAATVLGAIQVWISYCTWQGPSIGGLCRVRTTR